MRVRIKEPFSGFSHLAGLVLAIPGCVWLVTTRGSAASSSASLCVYAATLVALYAASSAYHLVTAGKRATRALRALNHLAIFLLVAGTSTPFFHRALDGAARTTMLAVIWGAAVVGILVRALWPDAPRALYTALYVAMGWTVVLRWGDVSRTVPPAALALVVAGGLTYTLGAVVYAVKRPNPVPRVFGFHEIWHLFVLGGSALHFAAIAELR